MDKAGIKPSAIDIIGRVEAPDKATQQAVFKEVEILCKFAHEIGAPTIQLNSFEALNGLSVADIGKEHNIRFQFEGTAWTPIAQLDDYHRLHMQ